MPTNVFKSFPFTPPTNPSHDYQVANKKYVDLRTLQEFGDTEDADTNWRIAVSGTDLVVQYNNGGGSANWVTKWTFNA